MTTTTDKLDDVIVPWIVRHAGYVITRCRVHECGRTSLHKMKGQKTHAPMIAFGEAVMFRIPSTKKKKIGDFEDRFEKGVVGHDGKVTRALDRHA